jgi:mono/diheme cytochrome c family protein
MRMSISICLHTAVMTIALSAASPSLGSELPGKTLFMAQCGNCHGPRDIAFWARQRPDRGARRIWLDQFLKKHYPPPDNERMAIVDYIEAVIAK